MKNFTDMKSNVTRRNVQILDDCEEFIKDWGCDLESRKPRKYVDVDGEHTEIDLFCLLLELARRKSIINIPTYLRSLPKEAVQEGMYVVSRKNRHGPVLNVISNKNHFAVSVLINDMNVITPTEVGYYRTFMLSGPDGKIREGWDTLEILTANEGIPDKIAISNVVHPGRWTSFYGEPYLLGKLYVDRLADEEKWYKKIVANLKKKHAVPTESPQRYYRSTTVKESVIVTGFEAEVDGAPIVGEYPTCEDSPQGFEDACKRLKTVRRLHKTMKFLCRGTEKAFYDHAVLSKLESTARVQAWLRGEVKGAVSVPGWVSWPVVWEQGYKESNRHRKLWARQELRNGMALRWRAWEQEEQIAAR